jgi:hypothetical protein
MTKIITQEEAVELLNGKGITISERQFRVKYQFNKEVSITGNELIEDFYFQSVRKDKDVGADVPMLDRVVIYKLPRPDAATLKLFERDAKYPNMVKVPLTYVEIAYDETAEATKELSERKVIVERKEQDVAQLSGRQYAAVHLGVPESGLEWLDDMIRKSNEQNVSNTRPKAGRPSTRVQSKKQ